MKRKVQVNDRPTLGPLIKVGTAAALLDASGRKIRSMCASGEIKAVKVGSDWRINTAAFLEQFGIEWEHAND